jgi:hypothetical protein
LYDRMSTAVAALAGVVVGAVLTYALAWRLDRRRDRLRAHGAARLLREDVFDGLLLVHAALAHERWPIRESEPALYALPVGADHCRHFRLDNWHRLAPDFTAAVPDFEDWEDVALAFDAMEAENHRLDSGEGRFDRPTLDHLRDRALPALHYLDDLQDGPIFKARRWWKTRGDRRGGSRPASMRAVTKYRHT